MRWLSVLWLALAAYALAPAEARAQEGEGAQEVARAGPDVLVLRPASGLERLARQTAALLERRRGEPVEVGEAPPPDILEAVPAGHLALAGDAAEDEEMLQLVLGAPGGVVYRTELALPRRVQDATVRAVALAIESLVDTAREAPPPEPRRQGEAWRGSRWIYIEGPPPETSIEPIAKPTLFLRLLFGVSPTRGTLLFGPGTGLGLCVTSHCVVLEGDLPIFAEETTARDGRTVAYRPITFSTRFQFRPFAWGDFTPGATFGLMTRIGNASVVDTDATELVTNVGLRSTLEMAWRFAPRFELVLEAGLDFAINRARFTRDDVTVLLEDRWTPWVVSSVRLRP